SGAQPIVAKPVPELGHTCCVLSGAVAGVYAVCCTNASNAGSYAGSAVLIPSTFDGTSARLARYCIATKFGTAMAARMPMMATTIMSSTSVNVFLLVL